MTSQTNSASALSQFQFTETRQLRVISIDGEPWFVASDVCAVLDLSNTTKALLRLDEDEKQVIDFATLNSIQGRENQTLSDFDPKTVNIINESGLYSLILTSRKPEAKQFKKWVTAEVLPAIRKTGRYQHPAASQPQEAHELITASDMGNLSRLVWLLVNPFRYKSSITQAIWYDFRACTNTPSPQRFQVRHIPLLAAEARRLFYITRAIAELIAEAETALVRRIIRRGENAEKVIEEIRLLLAKANDEDLQTADRHLGKWVEHEIKPLIERKPSYGGLYPECLETLN